MFSSGGRSTSASPYTAIMGMPAAAMGANESTGFDGYASACASVNPYTCFSLCQSSAEPWALPAPAGQLLKSHTGASRYRQATDCGLSAAQFSAYNPPLLNPSSTHLGESPKALTTCA